MKRKILTLSKGSKTVKEQEQFISGAKDQFGIKHEDGENAEPPPSSKSEARIVAQFAFAKTSPNDIFLAIKEKCKPAEIVFVGYGDEEIKAAIKFITGKCPDRGFTFYVLGNAAILGVQPITSLKDLLPEKSESENFEEEKYAVA